MQLRVVTIFLALLCLAVPAYLEAQPAPSLAPMVADDLDRDSLRFAIRRSRTYLEKLPRDRVVGEQPRRFTAGEVLDTLGAFERLLDQWDCKGCLAQELKAGFELLPSRSHSQAAEVLFTGYYQPVISGSLVPTAVYRYPIYGKPGDLMSVEQVALQPTTSIEKRFGRVEGERFTPYYSRREIDELGSLKGRGLELAWVKDPIDLFFLHIQGSGILRLPDGGQRHVGYAAGNGRPYRSIGRLLIDNGKIPQEEMSMQRLRRYLAENPAQRNEIMAYNESYVFFRIVENGPLGSLDVPLTPGRSIATDSRLFPKGALAFIGTHTPALDQSGQLIGWQRVWRFVLNQDTGGAIRGLRRADLYFGAGDEAGAAAGFMNSPGRLYFLSLKGQRGETKGSR